MELPQKKILLVEDDPFLGTLLAHRLERDGGFMVVRALTGDEALQKLETFVPDLVLLDIILPGKSGFEVLEELRQRPGATWPVIILSNLGQDVDMARGKELGAVDYVVKAKVSIDEIIQKVHTYLAVG